MRIELNKDLNLSHLLKRVPFGVEFFNLSLNLKSCLSLAKTHQLQGNFVHFSQTYFISLKVCLKVVKLFLKYLDLQELKG